VGDRMGGGRVEGMDGVEGVKGVEGTEGMPRGRWCGGAWR
jgi:hypothetical protein